jgi:hypothetical protein
MNKVVSRFFTSSIDKSIENDYDRPLRNEKRHTMTRGEFLFSVIIEAINWGDGTEHALRVADDDFETLCENSELLKQFEK